MSDEPKREEEPKRFTQEQKDLLQEAFVFVISCEEKNRHAGFKLKTHKQLWVEFAKYLMNCTEVD